jgi:hypothetical protein
MKIYFIKFELDSCSNIKSSAFNEASLDDINKSENNSTHFDKSFLIIG